MKDEDDIDEYMRDVGEMKDIKVYPAIDLMDGQAVRLVKGNKDKKKIYGDPLKIAKDFSTYVDKIHMVDLDGAFEGKPKNLDVVEEVLQKLDVNIQLGGGFRDLKTISRAYSIGVENVIMGTSAFDLDLLKRVNRQFDGLTVSLDSKQGNIAVEGWEEERDLRVEEAYDLIKDQIDRFVYTSTEKDGVLEGAETRDKFWDDEEFIYAGGVTTIDDIVTLNKVGFSGVIIGKALYEEKLELRRIEEELGDTDAG